MAEVPSSEQPHSPPSPPTILKHSSNHPVHQTLAILPFHTLIPTFSNNGSCQFPLCTCLDLHHRPYLTSCVTKFCALLCFLSLFTDSFMDNYAKIYYGIATFKGMYIFNCSNAEDMDRDLKKHRINFIDFVHTFMSLFVFLVFDLSNSSVQSSFSELGISELTMNLPLRDGNLSSFLFAIFPTTCRGIRC
ncbi:hypothetical protein D8674_007639 [Pyrus ussuriensis x Pyrus communis]|uniref:Uncharacterized protein n=1 Tax=Pyrus ussuriensis x Pyrus communis TaxID=2448454 RepID=A0A5N5HXB4_9ROSA|nr:hypothetical protein D8674_007639 [Pyrus ussuriensis x Pyrus communis]